MAKKIILISVVFLFPLFFLPATDNVFITNKLYLLTFGALTLLLVSGLQFLSSRRLIWHPRPFDWPVFSLVLAVILSAAVASPNKIQAILNPNFGLVAVFSLAILYFYLSRSNQATKQLNNILNISSALLSVAAIIFFFNPFKNLTLPVSLEFFKNANFTLLGSQLDLAIFLGFFVVLQFVILVRPKAASRINSVDSGVSASWRIPRMTNYIFITVNFIALTLTAYSLYKQPPTLPPFDISWYAALEALKHPLTAVFGVGADNFGYLFTRAKTVTFNQTPLARFDFFTLNRSALLHVLSTTGLLGFTSFMMLLIKLFKQQSKNGALKQLPSVYLFICLLIFPVSLPVLFLFFLLLSMTTEQPDTGSVKPLSLDLGKSLPAYLLVVVAAATFIITGIYLLGKNYLAEFYYGQALAAYSEKKSEEFFKNLQQAVILNPTNEKYHLNLSQAYLNLFDTTLEKLSKGSADPKESEQDQKMLSQAAQIAVEEAKTLTALNPYNSANWSYLGFVYKDVAQVNRDAAQWIISSYKNAMELDPKNPLHSSAISGVFYSAQQYDEATRFAEQAIDLRASSIDSYFSAAWSSFQLGYVQKAVNLMQNILSSLDEKKDEKLYKEVQQNLETFKQKLPTPTPTPKPKG